MAPLKGGDEGSLKLEFDDSGPGAAFQIELGGKGDSEPPSPRDIESLVAAFGRLSPPDRDRLLARAVELADWTDPPNGAVFGTVWYRERIAMPPDAVVVARVEHVRNGDAELVAEQLIDHPGNVPVPFQVPFAFDAIDVADRYALRIHIAAGDDVQWVTENPVPVITHGAPREVDVMVVRAAAGVG